MPAAAMPMRGIHQRLAFPPPPRRPSLAVMSGLDDLSDGLACALFLVARRTRDIADFPPDGIGRWKHEADIRAAARAAPELADDLLLLGSNYALDDAIGGPIARAASRLAKWATERGYAELAIQLAEAALAIRPHDARCVYEAGRINRLFGRLDVAEVLYGRAICLTRVKSPPPNGDRDPTPAQSADSEIGVDGNKNRTSKWYVYVRAHLGLGQIYQSRGQMETAAAHMFTAASAAWHKSREKWLAALAQHDLFTLMLAQRDYEGAFPHALKAYHWLPKHNERLPALVHDYCYLLLETNAATVAMPLLEELVKLDIPRSDLVLALSTFARATGVLGSTVRFRHAERQVRELSRFAENAAGAYVNLAIGARAIGCTAEAEEHALHSKHLAAARGDAIVQGLAEDLLRDFRQNPATTPARVTDPPSHVRALARDLAARLRGWRGPLVNKRKRSSSLKRLKDV